MGAEGGPFRGVLLVRFLSFALYREVVCQEYWKEPWKLNVDRWKRSRLKEALLFNSVSEGQCDAMTGWWVVWEEAD